MAAANSTEKKPSKTTHNDNAPRVIVVENKPDFDKYITETINKHILVEFFATWCGPCHIIGKRLEELAKEYDEKLIILKVDVDNLEELANEHDVSSMPTFMIYKNKVKLEQFVGSNSEKVESTLEKFCGKPLDSQKATEQATTSSSSKARTSTKK